MVDSTALSTCKHKILEEILEMLTLNINDEYTQTHITVERGGGRSIIWGCMREERRRGYDIFRRH